MNIISNIDHISVSVGQVTDTFRHTYSFNKTKVSDLKQIEALLFMHILFGDIRF